MSVMSLYHQAPTLFWVGVIVLGLLVGSFLNVVIYRLPIMMQRQWHSECSAFLEEQGKPALAPLTPVHFNLATPNSTCPHCKTPIKPWQNIPVISYLFLRGACAKCKKSISLRYPLIEATSAILCALVFWHFGPAPAALLGFVLVWGLISLTMIDVDHYLLPDTITLPLLWLGLMVNLWGIYAPLEEAVLGAALGYLSLWSVYWLFKLITGKEGMGYGDFKLLAALGAWMGWQSVPLIILLSSFVGAFLGIGAILIMGRDKAKPLPFGPYLAIAGLVAFIWGTPLIQYYLTFMAISR